jgi:regulatory protein
MTPEAGLALERAVALAYAQLNRRERTQREITEHLLDHHVQPDVTAEALRRLSDEGYVDDNRFARLFVQDKSDLERWGSDRIRRALLARGVPDDVADAALDEDARPNELERALSLLERRLPDGLAGRRESERALGVLLRKGYEYELAADALSEHRRRASSAAAPRPTPVRRRPADVRPEPAAGCPRPAPGRPQPA